MATSVYIETSIVSYLVARPSRDPQLAEHQLATREWWERQRGLFRCVTSEEAAREAKKGEPAMARLRMEALAEIDEVPITAEMRSMAEQFLHVGAIPATMSSDALHLAVAVMAEVNYLLTWNCRHLANEQILERLGREAERLGWELPTVCTPLKLKGVLTDAPE